MLVLGGFEAVWSPFFAGRHRALSGKTLFVGGAAPSTSNASHAFRPPLRESRPHLRLRRPPPALPFVLIAARAGERHNGADRARLLGFVAGALARRQAPHDHAASTSTSVGVAATARSAYHGSLVDGEKGERHGKLLAGVL